MRFLALLLLTVLVGCQLYHDTTAHYNAYFLADERLREIEEGIWSKHKDDYSQLLQVLVPLDTSTTKGNNMLDSVIYLAAKPIQFHEQSKWVPQCYILIGKARMYKADFPNAISTLKFVNSEYEEFPNARHTALIDLMRVFIESREYNNFLYVKDFIAKEQSPLSQENLKNYHLTMAHYYRQIEDLEPCALHLEIATPLIKTKKHRARLYYLLGQIYEQLGQEQKSFLAFSQVSKNRPNFDLSFQSAIVAEGLQKVENEQNEKKVLKFYNKMLKDEKYWDYRDKIHYELGKFKQKRNQLPAAMDEFNQSILLNVNNPSQKTFSYLRLGDIHLDSLKNYEKGAAYYDSAVSSMPPRFKNADYIRRKATMLQDLAVEMKIIEENTRLLALSELSFEQRDSVFAYEIAQERAQILKGERNKKIAEKLKQPPTAGSSLAKTQTSTEWYFYNDKLLYDGKEKFTRDWGARKLEDNWRRSSKPFASGEKDDKEPDTKAAGSSDAVDDIFASIKSAQQREEEIPLDTASKGRVSRQLHESLFKVGKLYLYKFKEPALARKAFDNLIDNYPNAEQRPEALFTNHSICRQNPAICPKEPYKNTLISQHPESVWAKLLINPNYLIELEAETKTADSLYAIAYKRFEAEQYGSAEQILKLIEEKYPNYVRIENVKVLAMMIFGKKVSDIADYYIVLTDYIEQKPQSPLTPFVRKLLAALTEEEQMVGNMKKNAKKK
jgi:tetratricopeptide (TPR) repeat protein